MNLPDAKELVEKVIKLNSFLVSNYGGMSGGIKDRGLLESALDRPRNLLAYSENIGIKEIAVAYTVGIIKNHPFCDGNKRTGFAVLFCFLLTNNLKLIASNEDVVVQIVDLASGRISEKQFLYWLDNCVEECQYSVEDKLEATQILVERYEKALISLFNK
jgi:death on curing protein